ncbi:MAG: stage II sporulation protein P [bacterium]
MKKRFYAKKRKNSNKYINIFIFIVFFIIAFSYVYTRLNITISDEVIVSYILNNNEDEFNFGNLTSAEFLLNYTFNSNYNFDSLVFNETKPENKSDPLVYIYNTHPTEYYAATNYEIFNVTPTVITASYMLKEYLSDYSIPSIVEQRSVTDILTLNAWSYAYSYDASRIYLEEIIKEYPSIKYFVDLHRDAASKEATTTQIDGESCIKFMFVVGAEYSGYEENLELANLVNSKLININKDFSRGVIKKEGTGVNGIYNQDLSGNLILIEAGAQYNTIDEVNCGMKYISEVLAEVILSEGE